MQALLLLELVAVVTATLLKGPSVRNIDLHASGLRALKETSQTFSFNSDNAVRLLTNVTIGGQSLSLSVDVCSGDFFVFQEGSVKECANNSLDDCVTDYALFDPFSSRSFVNLTIPAIVTSRNGRNITGFYANDNITLDNFQNLTGKGSDSVLFGTNGTGKFALMNTYPDGIFAPFGLFGVGYKDGEVSSTLQMLRENGWIESNAVSFYMNDNNVSTTLFGQIDNKKYKNSMQIYGFQETYFKDFDRTVMQYPYVPLTALSVTNGKGAIAGIAMGINESVIIDSTRMLSHLPFEVLVQLAIQLNAVYSDDLKVWVQTCSYRSLNATVDLIFDSTTISVPIADILLEVIDGDSGKTYEFSQGEQACFLAFRASEVSGYSSLGWAVLRHMYTVIDFDNRLVGIAQVDTSNESAVNLTNINSNLTDFASATIPHGAATTTPLTITVPQFKTCDGCSGVPQVGLSADQFFTTSASSTITSAAKSTGSTNAVSSGRRMKFSWISLAMVPLSIIYLI